MIRTLLFFAAISLAGSTATARAASPEKAPEKLPRLVVPALVAERDVDAGIVRLLNELLLTEFNRTRRYVVIGNTDIGSLLSLEQQKDLVGCNDTRCLVEVGGALSADYLASANIGRIGSFFLLNVKIIRVSNGEVVQRWSEQVEGIEDKLMTAVRKSVSAVSGVSLPPPAPMATAEWSAGSGRPARWIPVSLWGIGAAGLALGVVYGLQTRTHYDNATRPAYLGGQVEDADGRRTQIIANAGFGVAAAGAISGLLVWWLQGRGTETSEVAVDTRVGPSWVVVSAHF